MLDWRVIESAVDPNDAPIAWDLNWSPEKPGSFPNADDLCALGLQPQDTGVLVGNALSMSDRHKHPLGRAEEWKIIPDGRRTIYRDGRYFAQRMIWSPITRSDAEVRQVVAKALRRATWHSKTGKKHYGAKFIDAAVERFMALYPEYRNSAQLYTTWDFIEYTFDCSATTACRTIEALRNADILHHDFGRAFHGSSFDLYNGFASWLLDDPDRAWLDGWDSMYEDNPSLAVPPGSEAPSAPVESSASESPPTSDSNEQSAAGPRVNWDLLRLRRKVIELAKAWRRSESGNRAAFLDWLAQQAPGCGRSSDLQLSFVASGAHVMTDLQPFEALDAWQFELEAVAAHDSA